MFIHMYVYISMRHRSGQHMTDSPVEGIQRLPTRPSFHAHNSKATAEHKGRNGQQMNEKQDSSGNNKNCVQSALTAPADY